MGPARTLRMHNFIDALLDAPLSLYGYAADATSHVLVESDEEADHLILEWEEHRDAGSIFDQYGSFIGSNNVYQSLAEEIDVPQFEYVVSRFLLRGLDRRMMWWTSIKLVRRSSHPSILLSKRLVMTTVKMSFPWRIRTL